MRTFYDFRTPMCREFTREYIIKLQTLKNKYSD